MLDRSTDSRPSDSHRVYVSDFDALLARRDLRAVPLQPSSQTSPSAPWSAEARAALLGLVLGLAVVMLVAVLVVLR